MHDELSFSENSNTKNIEIKSNTNVNVNTHVNNDNNNHHMNNHNKLENIDKKNEFLLNKLTILAVKVNLKSFCNVFDKIMLNHKNDGFRSIKSMIVFNQSKNLLITNIRLKLSNILRFKRSKKINEEEVKFRKFKQWRDYYVYSVIYDKIKIDTENNVKKKNAKKIEQLETEISNNNKIISDEDQRQQNIIKNINLLKEEINKASNTNNDKEILNNNILLIKKLQEEINSLDIEENEYIDQKKKYEALNSRLKTERDINEEKCKIILNYIHNQMEFLNKYEKMIS